MKQGRELQFIENRQGNIVPFNPEKVRSAIERAGRATGEFGMVDSMRMASQVINILAHRHQSGTPNVEEVQDVVEHVLIANNYFTDRKSVV